MSLSSSAQSNSSLPCLIDSHCHLNRADFQDEVPQLLAAAAAEGVTRVVNIGVEYESSCAACRLAAEHEGVFAAVGVHPHEAEGLDKATLNRIAELAQLPKVVAYGEIGLDYGLMLAPREAQLKAFSRQLALARELNLPVVIHDREAHEETARCIKAAGHLPQGGVLHCFSGDLAFARDMIDQGFMISFSGVLTFKNAEALREVARALDLVHLMVETDSPYLTPVPFRGKRNEPARVVYTARILAEVKGLPLEEVARQTTANACRLFHLPELSVSGS